MSKKVILLNNNKKLQNLLNFKKKLGENRKMFFVVIACSAALGMLAWDFFVENPSRLDVQISPSKNITFGDKVPQAMTTTQIANEFEHFDGKPVLLYIYTTWCPVCSQQFPLINEIAREFQNTDLQVLALAIDRDLDGQALKAYLNKSGNLYFEPRFLAFREGFLEFLKKKNIKYQGRIPFTVLISRHGEVKVKYVGVKGKNYLRNKVIKEL
ncbi:MAG: TlpA disulfide reductase family protein [Rickettsiales bacterium]|nr:TlpA disulfide reductase family protein [Rickettsiales bacterium]